MFLPHLRNRFPDKDSFDHSGNLGHPPDPLVKPVEVDMRIFFELPDEVPFHEIEHFILFLLHF